MSKCCKKCGEKLEGDYKFCPGCGESTKQTINQDYKLPSLSLLNKPKMAVTDDELIEKIISKIELCLKSYGIISKVVEVQVGPLMTRYELEVVSGTDFKKISRLNKEIALALSKKDVKIEIPVPSKSTVGITINNDDIQAVTFYKMMENRVMKEANEKVLMVPLGETPIGEIGICEIDKMPHLLISGTTGSGKTVLLNSIICSILMRAKPDEVRLALVDTKVIEFNCYNGIPHLLCPVINNSREAINLLNKMVNEAEKRYYMFANTGTREIEGYNEFVKRHNEAHPNDLLDIMPYIVVVIDDLLDLMVSANREVEDTIIRLTQKARSAGIHLIISTQRPSREVITDIIKTNIPSRISFVVSSRADSNIILDQEGAEDLTGKGDMLFLPIGTKKPIRIQGTFIHDNEIQKIIDYTKLQQEAYYDNSFIQKEEKKSSVEFEEASDDELYNEIVDFVIRSGKASASLLQRKFKIGYNKAATMIDELEANGIIGPATGNSAPREVLVKYSDKD